MQKVCSCCGKSKPVTDFYPLPYTPGKFRAKCKACMAKDDAAKRKRKRKEKDEALELPPEVQAAIDVLIIKELLSEELGLALALQRPSLWLGAPWLYASRN